MEEAIVGSLLGATFQVVIQNLLSVSVEFKQDLEKLEKSFLMVRDFLHDARAHQHQATKAAVKRWLKELEATALEAENVLDELNYEVLRKKMETGNKLTKKVRDFFSHSNPVVFRMKMAGKIRDINKKLKLINQEAIGFGLQRHVGVSAPDVGSEALAGRETDSFAVDPIVLERENDVSRIVEVLTDSTAEHVVSVLPVVGMGGIGKTTVARQVYGNEKIKCHFEKFIWVYVSRNFDAVVLFKKILESLAVENFHLENREGLLKKLKENLGVRRYLLVLDDFWGDEMEKWDDFLSSLSGVSSVKGNGVIVTTRSEKVASVVRTLPDHRLEALSEINCWSIIKAKAFREGDIPSEFETMGKNIAKRCQGLPLAAKVVGGLLRDKYVDEWRSIEENWLLNFGEDENNISKILKLSFDHLSPPPVKMCFAYCSIFPKGFCIKREELIELWMAEGFLQNDLGNDMEVVGDRFFNLLLQNSLLQTVARDVFGNTTDCNMHDLVHDLASSVLGCKRVYVNNDNNNLGDSHLTEKQARYLSTVFTTNKLSNNLFSKFKRLHVLVLMGEDIKELSAKIRMLIHLRYLDISCTGIEECLPDTIGKLYHLQTLRAGHCLRKLPNTLKNLTSLRHLHIPDIELPLEIGRLTCLQTLPYFRVGDKKGSRIEELGSLKNLTGKLEISYLEKVDGKEDAKSARLFQKPSICKLKFVWNSSRQGEINYENVLDGLQPHPNLKSLEICRFEGRSFPPWALKMAVRDDRAGVWAGLNNLMDVRLTNCRECEEIPMFGHLWHLKSLYLEGLTNVNSITCSFYGTDNGIRKNTSVVFPALERLELLEMPNLTEWVEIELPTAAETQLHQMVVFPSLEYLKIENCSRLTSAPSHFPCLKELEILGMESSSPLASICGINLSSLTKLKIKRLDGLVCLPDHLFGNNHNLSELTIEDCPNLTRLVPCLEGGGSSLRKLRIFSCGNLTELPNDLHSLNSLHTLEIYFCEGLTNLPSEMVESCAPSLESLRLVGLSSLMNSTAVTGCLQKMARLKFLEILDVPRITNFPVDIGPLCNLQELQIGPSSYSFDLVSFEETLDGILKVLQSVPRLALWGEEHWDSLPYQLQHLGSLTHLELRLFGVEALPEWLENLSSLEGLSLTSCTKLRHLPSKKAMQRLTKLNEVSIVGCPLLKGRCIEQEGDDSEWSKLSHIPYVYVDGRQISSLDRKNVQVSFCYSFPIFMHLENSSLDAFVTCWR